MEVGPGPGLTTDWLRSRVKRLTCIEMDSALANSLRSRTANSNVTVECGDAAAMPFTDDVFSSAVCFTMLHHVPSTDLQDRLFAEVYRVLKPGGVQPAVLSDAGRRHGRRHHERPELNPLTEKTPASRGSKRGNNEQSIRPEKAIL